MRKLSLISFCLLSLNVLSQAAGSLDPTFGIGGKVTTSITTGQDMAYGVAIQSDGKILVAGYSSSTVTGKDFALVRYNADGTLDIDFGTNGIVTTDVQLGSEDVAYSIALQLDGKIVLGGYSDNGSNKDAALVRYNEDGTLDMTFGNNGKVVTNFEGVQQDEIKVVKIHQLTGNIIVGGFSQISSSVSKPVVARYLSDGTLDNTFNLTGIKLLWVTSLDYQYFFSVEDLVVQSNGKISAVGWRDFPGQSWSSDFWACRINSDGSMDNTFSSDGVNTYNGGFNGHDRGYAMLLKSNNNFIMAGGSYVSTLKYDFRFFEVSSAGASTTPVGVADWGSLLDDIAYGLAEDGNGKLVLAGTSGTANSKTFAIARFNANGSVDNSFGASGKVSTTFGSNALNECYAVTVQSDNKIVVVGYAGNAFAVARFLGENVPDLNGFQLTSPANQAVNQNFASVALDWTDAFGATSYQIQVDVNQSFDSPQTYSSSSSNYTVVNLQPNTQYFWRVRAGANSNWGTYSAAWSFTTNSLTNFNHVSPTNNSINQEFNSLLLDWTNNLGAANYEVQIDSTQTFTTSPATYTASNSQYAVTNLLPSKTYYWKVRASNGTIWGEWTNPWSFTTKAQSGVSLHSEELLGIKVFPNPSSDVVFFECSDVLINQSYSLVDPTGRVVLSGAILANQTQINLSDLAIGLYFLQIGDLDRLAIQVVKN